MALFKRKAIGGDSRVDPHFNQDNLNQRELLNRHYGRNHQFQEYLNHSIGLVHNCATINAKACTASPLRLYKIQRGAKVTRSLGTKAVSSQVTRGMKSGVYGAKVANMASSGLDMVEVENHALLDLIARPNPLYPGSMMEHQKWYSLWVGGNAYEYASTDASTPYMLSPMLSQYVTIEASIENTIDRYIYGRARHRWGEYDPSEVIHYKLYPSPHSPLEGIGATYGVLPHADLLQDCLIHDISMAKNGMHPDGIWMLPEGTAPEQSEKFEKQLKSKFRGARDWWKHLIFSGKVEFVSPLIPEKELLSLPKQEEAAKLIRQAFGHTESMADSTDTNVASAIQSYDKQYLGGTIWPALINDADTKNQYLLPMFGLDPDAYCFAYDNPVERDEARFSERMSREIATGLRTTNEARSEMGLPEIDNEFADQLLVNGQPLGQSLAPADPFAGLFGGGSQSTQSDDKPEPDEPDQEPLALPEGESTDDEKRASFGKFKAAFLKAEAGEPCGFCTKAEGPDGIDLADDDILVDAMFDHEANMQATMQDILTDAQAESLTAYGSGNPPNLDALRDQAADMLTEAMADVVVQGAEDMAQQIKDNPNAPPLPATFNITPQAAMDFLQTYTLELADDLMGTTADMANQAIQTGFDNGLSVDEIADLMTDIPETRATMIARTEVQRAVQNGKRLTMVETGIENVEWVTAPGASAAHQLIAARSPMPISEPFVKSGETLAGESFKRDIFVPPARPNCRCSVFPVYDDE